MVDLTRRKTVIGLGLLATGSGATFTSAAFQSTAAADSDLRVLVEQQGLEFTGDSANSGDPNTVDNPDFFEDDPSGGLNETAGGAFDGDGPQDNAPLAYAAGTNENLTVKTLVPLGEEETFDNLFEVRNNSDETVTIGIAYDRNNADFDAGDDSGQYGADINVGGGGLNENDAQSIYQFHKSPNTDTDVTIYGPIDNQPTEPDSLISPKSGNSGVEGTGPEGTNIVNADLPAHAAEIPSGSVLRLDLKVNAKTPTDLSDRIDDRAVIDDSALGLQQDTVQIIDGITVVSFGDQVNDPR